MVVTNDFQAKYVAATFNRRYATGKLEKLIPVFLQSGLEVYPHQIEAAVCALHNPYSKGYILADEVGLGKAVEAGLIIAQSYYDGADDIIAVVPNDHTAQWCKLITERFGLSAEEVSGADSLAPKDEKTVKIITYENAAALSEPLKETPWSLAVFDEAHRLRKFRQSESKTAEALYDSFSGCKKILLTGTPIIGNVMDLWGLITFIDDTVFPDKDAFYKRYYKKPENYPELRELLSPFIFRTLRRQVKADVLLPERLVHTELYKLSAKELELYKGLEKYLSKPKKIAFPEMDAYELNLMIFKIFSSSIYALGKTLAGILSRLKKTDGEDAATEAKEIENLLNLATSITDTSKGAAFIKTLTQAFHSLKEKGLPQKAIVFTENRETQDYIIKLIAKQTKFNAIEYKDSRDIERFRAKTAHILVATDVAGEGFDMEFSNAVINYDLPWGLQKVEQRIGRAHRIGQKNDVLVFNFLNNENFADVRLYELAYRRSVTTSDILGVSDDFISNAAPSTTQSVADMVATGRSAPEVVADFEDLQERFAEYVTENRRAGNETLFNTFDERVAEKTKNYAEYIRTQVAEARTRLWAFCKYAARGYGTADDDKKTISIHKSVFKSGNIPHMTLYLNDDGTRDRPSLITLTNTTVKQLLGFYGSGNTSYGGATATIPDRQSEHGIIALYQIQFHSDTNGTSVSLFVGQADDGRILTEDECRLIIENTTAATVRLEQDFDDAKTHAAELLSRVFPKLETEAVEELNDGLNDEIVQVRRRTVNSITCLENEIKAAESEVAKTKGAGAHLERSENAFISNQQAQNSASRLLLLKQNEAMEKMKLKKHEADELAALTARAKLFTYTDCRFVVEYAI